MERARARYIYDSVVCCWCWAYIHVIEMKAFSSENNHESVTRILWGSIYFLSFFLNSCALFILYGLKENNFFYSDYYNCVDWIGLQHWCHKFIQFFLFGCIEYLFWFMMKRSSRTFNLSRLDCVYKLNAFYTLLVYCLFCMFFWTHACYGISRRSFYIYELRIIHSNCPPRAWHTHILNN